MSAEETLMALLVELQEAIVSHEKALETRTDTGLMWRCGAYKGIRDFLADRGWRVVTGINAKTAPKTET